MSDMGRTITDATKDRVRGSFTPVALRDGVLITIHRFSYGGADRVAVLLANGFAAAGLRTGIVLLREGGEGQHALLKLLDPTVAVACAGASLRSRHLELVRGLRFIGHQIDLAEPAIVLASSSNMGLVTGLSRRATRASAPRYVMKLTNPVIRPTHRSLVRRSYRKWLYDFIFARFDQVLLLSEMERVSLNRLYPWYSQRFSVVPNPYVSAEMFDAPSRQVGGVRRILALARLMPQKRLDRLICAFALMQTRNARLVIVGDGPERARLQHLAASMGVADRLDLPGFVEDVVPWLMRADVLALTSDYEGLPAAVLEALAAGVPVVTTDCFEEAHALLDQADQCAVVAVDDIDALARTLDGVLANPERPTTLSMIARPYEMHAAVAAHVAAVTAGDTSA